MREWKREVWVAAIVVSCALGGILGGRIAQSFGGAVVGAFVALPVGAVVALAAVCLGAAFLRLTRIEHQTPLSRLSFGVLLAVAVMAILSICAAAVGGLSVAVIPIATFGAIGFAFGAVRPPSPGPQN